MVARALTTTLGDVAQIVLADGTILPCVPGADGGGGGYDTIQQAGVALPQETIINFVSGATVVDDPVHNRTNVTIAGASATGTGFFHFTAGVADPAARAVNLASADVTGTLPPGNGGTGVTSSGAAGNVLRSNGAAWVSAAIQPTDLPTITLTGDVTGSGTGGSVPTVVVKVNGATVPAAGALTPGNVLQVGGASALAYGTLDLANAATVGASILGVPNGGTGINALGVASAVLMATGGTTMTFATDGSIPFFGEGWTTESPDGGVSNFEGVDCTNSIALPTNAAVTLFTTTVSSPGDSLIVDCEFLISKDGSSLPADRAIIRRTIAVVNNGGVLTTPSGGTSDTDMTPATFVGSNMVGAVCALVINGAAIVANATRPAGVACHAMVTRVEFRGATP